MSRFQIIELGGKNFKEVAKKAVKLIKQGKVIICPTDTVYGLISDATNKKSVDKIFKIKKRTTNKPAPIFVKNLNIAKKYAKITKKQEDFLKKIWPGKVTVILKNKKRKIYGVLKNSIALRVPKYKLIDEIFRKIERPLIGTSANISGYPASTKPAEIIKQFKNVKHLPDIVISAGNLKKSKPSTIIDLTKSPPKIIRCGERRPSGASLAQLHGAGAPKFIKLI